MNRRWLHSGARVGAVLASATLCVTLSSLRAFAKTLYVTDSGLNAVLQITPGGVVSPFITMGLNTPSGIVFDAAGNLYVANAAATLSNNVPAISKYDSAGVQQPFTLSTPLLNPLGMTTDADGNLYVVSFAANGVDTLINKVTSAGVVSTFAADAGAQGAAGVARDASGNVYVGDLNNAVVSKYNSSGTPQPFPLSGISLAAPQGLTTDAQGNVFVADGITNAVDRINPAGMVTSFLTGAELNDPNDVQRDAAGNFYVVTLGDLSVHKYNSAGVLQPFTLSGTSLSSPNMLAVGPTAAAAAPEPGVLLLTLTAGTPLLGLIVRRRPQK